MTPIDSSHLTILTMSSTTVCGFVLWPETRSPPETVTFRNKLLPLRSSVHFNYRATSEPIEAKFPSQRPIEGNRLKSSAVALNGHISSCKPISLHVSSIIFAYVRDYPSINVRWQIYRHIKWLLHLCEAEESLSRNVATFKCLSVWSGIQFIFYRHWMCFASTKVHFVLILRFRILCIGI